MRPRIFYVTWLIAPYRAMTIPPFGIFVHVNHKGNFRILRHDYIHWLQYRRMGLILFYFRYFCQLLFIGYATMPMELEARQNEPEHLKYRYTQKYHKL